MTEVVSSARLAGVGGFSLFFSLILVKLAVARLDPHDTESKVSHRGDNLGIRLILCKFAPCSLRGRKKKKEISRPQHPSAANLTDPGSLLIGLFSRSSLTFNLWDKKD